MPSSVQVQVADGARLNCFQQLIGAKWSVQHCTFTSDFRVLPLSSYDIILGMDWLVCHSPMKVHWLQKWMIIPYQESSVLLQGLSAVCSPGSVVAVHQLEPVSQSVTDLKLPSPLLALLSEFLTVFEPPSGLPPSRYCDHSIPLIPGASPVKVRPYRYPPAVKDEIERQIKVMLQSGIVQPSVSPFSSSVLLVKKKDNTWRFCVDFRHLNAITLKSHYPVPVIEELLDELGNASWFTSLDLTAGYHQILLHPDDTHKTAFQTHSGHYEFRVMAFGLTGAPATFQRAMNDTLAPLLRRGVLVFFDDILIYSATFEDHLLHLRSVLELLARDQWQLKLSKCSFAQSQLSYLGHLISAQGVATDPSKIQAVAEWSTPGTVKELRSFLGLAGYYRRFVKHFGLIARPLQALLKKGALFVWTSEHEAAFQALKDALITAPVLALPNFSLPFCLETDASAVGVGAVLMQAGHPVAYLSKALGIKSQGLSTYEKEYLAILMAVDHWRHYLQLKEFHIHTDHRSLAQLDEQRLHTPWQKKMFTRLLGLQYRIVYKRGVDNSAADALSRHPQMQFTCSAVSSCTPQWITDIAESYRTDEIASAMIAKLAIDGSAVPHFSWHNGILRYKNRIWVGQSPALQQRLLSVFHESAVGGHSGIPVTYARLKQLFAWKGMKHTVQEFVRHCVICQQAKADRARLPGLLQPLPVPTGLWQIISMDFIEALPQSQSYTCILVIVDTFTKYANFLPLKHPFTALSVARLFHDQIYKHHGLPQSIISDRDKIFLSLLWQELFRLADVQLRMSSAYHPQSDGQTERVNQCLETFLRCFVHACPHQWSQWLSVAQFWYNSSPHSATGRSPFELLYGCQPRQFGISPDAVISSTDLDVWLQERHLMSELVRQHLERAKLRMKRQADKRRSEREFAVGDWVFLKLQPYVQSSVAPRAHQKLAFKFFGPFRVVQRVGAVAYKLLLPDTSKVHPVFHVSQLKKALGVGLKASPTLPTGDFAFNVPEMILQHRTVARGTTACAQILVKWTHMPAELATWEDVAELRQQFPRAAVWGQPPFKEGGNVGLHQETKRPRKKSVKVFGPNWVN